MGVQASNLQRVPQGFLDSKKFRESVGISVSVNSLNSLKDLQCSLSEQCNDSLKGKSFRRACCMMRSLPHNDFLAIADLVSATCPSYLM